MHKLATISLALALGAGFAAADVRIDPDDPTFRPTPTKTPTESPVIQSTPVQDKGCNAREGMSPEWLFGLCVLGLGAWGLRRFAPPEGAGVDHRLAKRREVA